MKSPSPGPAPHQALPASGSAFRFRRTFAAPACGCALAWVGLAAQTDETKPFRLPAGDSDSGREAFVALRCIHCHGVKGVHLEHPELYRRIRIDLAASTRFVTDSASLILAIATPRHVTQERYGAALSPTDWDRIDPFMPDFSTRMTVRELMDLVAFLEQSYEEGLPSFQSSRKGK